MIRCSRTGSCIRMDPDGCYMSTEMLNTLHHDLGIDTEVIPGEAPWRLSITGVTMRLVKGTTHIYALDQGRAASCQDCLLRAVMAHSRLLKHGGYTPLQLLFFSRDTAEETSVQKVHNNYTGTRTLTQTKPACRCSPSTSQLKGRLPSAPPGTRKSTKEQANARAAAQESKDHHRSLHACSTRLRNNGGSERALNRARDRMKVRVSSDQRPPTSPANTTNRHNNRAAASPSR